MVTPAKHGEIQFRGADSREQQALVLDAQHHIDLHLACDLLVKGCDRVLAWEILLLTDSSLVPVGAHLLAVADPASSVTHRRGWRNAMIDS